MTFHESRGIKLLGLRMRDINKKDRVSLWYLITAARQLYAKYWKSEKIPKLDEWRHIKIC